MPKEMPSSDGTTTLETFLFKIRDICRDHGVQMDELGNMYADLIYDDLLFLKHIPALISSGAFVLNKEELYRGTPLSATMPDNVLESIVSLRETPQMVGGLFDRVWKQLGRSSFASIFTNRLFPLCNILKTPLRDKYFPLLAAILDYTNKVKLEEHEDTDPYEYFTKDLKKAKSKYFGQFYTPAEVCWSCIEELAPKYGEIGLDPMAGTGKFMRIAASYIHKNEPTVSAADAFKNMRTVEIESQVYRQGKIAALLTYHSIPDDVHHRLGDSFELLSKEEEPVDFIAANPPYGGTITRFDEYYYTSVAGSGKKAKKVMNPDIKHPFAFIKKDTSVLALQLIVNKLKDGGRAAAIFNGTIMNNAHRDVMKWFLDTCDLRKVIVNPSGTFKCTGIETYSLIFWKGTPTTRVEYVEFGTGKVLGSFTRAELEARGLDIRPIFSTVSSDTSDVVYKTIEEICDVTKGTVQASKAIPGDFPIYSAAATVSTHNTFTHEGEAIIFVNGSRGPPLARVHYAKPGEKFSASSLVIVLKPKSDDISGKYLWYLLNLRKGAILKMFESSNMRETINTADFIKYSVPLPPRAVQDEIVATLDRIYAPGTTELADTLKMTDRAMDLVLASPSGTTLGPIVEAQRLIRKSAQMVADVKAQMVADVKAQMVAIVKSVGIRGFAQKKLSEACDISKGKRCLEAVSAGGYPYQDVAKISRMVAKYILDTPAVLTPRAMSIGRFVYVDEKCHPSDDMFIMNPKDGLHVKYLYYYCTLLLSAHFRESLHGVKPTIDYSVFDYTNITIPPLAFQEAVLTRLEALQSRLTALESLQKDSEENARFILESYLGAPAAGEEISAPVTAIGGAGTGPAPDEEDDSSDHSVISHA
jgi:hypothetical protein